MRVALLHWGFSPIIGGVETHLGILGPGMVDKGHEVWLITGTVTKEDILEFDYYGMKVVRTPLFDLNWLYQRGFEGLNEEINGAVKSFLDRVRPDVIHAHNMHYFSKIHAQALGRYAKSKQIPLILSAHNVWDEGEFLELTRNIGWDHIIAVSNFIRNELLSIGIPDESVSVVHHGIDVDRFENAKPNKVFVQYPFLEGKNIIFHPARMGLAKGSDISVKAFYHIKKELGNVALILTGTKNIIDWGLSQQKDIAYILHLIKILGLELNRDITIDMIPYEDIPSFYKASKVSLYPSTVSEPFGLTMLESMASGVPIIVTEAGGMPEVVKDGVNGYVVKVRDYKGIADHCMRLITDTKLRDSLSVKAKKLARKKYDKNIMIDNILKIYNRKPSSPR